MDSHLLPDDDDFVTTFPVHESYRYPHSDLPQHPTNQLWQWLASTKGIVAAVAVILLFHQWSNPRRVWQLIRLWLDCVRQEGWMPTLREYAWTLLDRARAYYQMTLEIMRSLKINIAPRVVEPSNASAVAASVARHTSYGLGSSPPPLVDMTTTTTSTNHPTTSRSCSPSDSSSASSSTRQTAELEPAFLNPRDYPEGWLVYHSALGVVLKTEADRYDEQQQGQASFPPSTSRGSSISPAQSNGTP